MCCGDYGAMACISIGTGTAMAPRIFIFTAMVWTPFRTSAAATTTVTVSGGGLCWSG